MKYSALEGYGNKYWPICSSVLAYRNIFPDREAYQATVYRVKKSQTLLLRPCMHRHKTFFTSGSSAPGKVDLEGDSTSWLVGILAVSSVQPHGLPLHRSYGPIRIFFPASYSWQSGVLFGQSFSIVLLFQPLRGLPCLGSFSGDSHIRHIEGPPFWGSNL